jgi:hypothetical protein
MRKAGRKSGFLFLLQDFSQIILIMCFHTAAPGFLMLIFNHNFFLLDQPIIIIQVYSGIQ